MHMCSQSMLKVKKAHHVLIKPVCKAQNHQLHFPPIKEKWKQQMENWFSVDFIGLLTTRKTWVSSFCGKKKKYISKTGACQETGATLIWILLPGGILHLSAPNLSHCFFSFRFHASELIDQQLHLIVTFKRSFSQQQQQLSKSEAVG